MSITERFPAHIQPYARLMRLHQPVGIWLLLWPCWWSIALAAETWQDGLMLLPFAVGAVVMRGAGCVINDIWDRELDSKVERTKDRPLASGELSVKQAFAFFAGLMLAGLVILLTFNRLTIFLGLVSVVPVIVYPLMKRLTFWPQAFLGFVFNWGALMGWAALENSLHIPAFLLYFACFFWTLGYDTIYALQDKEGDALIGIKSTALRFGDSTKKFLKRFYYSMFMLFVCVGIWGDLYPGFFAVMLLAGAHLSWQVKTLNMESPENCKNRFRSNTWLGWIIFAAILAGKIPL